jgi:hypothetical protein
MGALDIFVVLYRCDMRAAETLKTLSQVDFRALGIDVEVHIWDNARAEPAPPVGHSLPFTWSYYASAANEPLSKIYNTLVRRSQKSHLVIFDQDSSVNNAFFQDLTDSIKRIRADVFVPIIKHNGQTISPGRLRWIKGAALRSVVAGTLLPAGFTAMMSGLCIRRAFLARFGVQPFDERLRLYGVDTRFCRDLTQLGGRGYVTGAVLGHDSALRSTIDPCAVLQRQIWLWQSWLCVFDRNLIEILAIRFYVLWKAWRVTVGLRAPNRFFAIVSEVFR